MTGKRERTTREHVQRPDEEHPDDRAAVRLNARLATSWARRTVERLRRERGGINAINVFPVADGDTGSNLYLTVRSAYRAVEELEGPATLPEVVSAMATGALRGARGNSGLILSVALRGVADALEGIDVPAAGDFAEALSLAAARAREAVETPVDGTMVTVLDAMAEEAQLRAAAGDSLVALVEAVRDRSRTALRETTGQLPVLRENQVVDAGSSGIVELFDLLYLTVTGMEPGGKAAAWSAGNGAPASGADPARARSTVPSRAVAAPRPTGLELVAHLGEAKDRARPLRRALAKAGGTSIVVSWPMAHVHTASGGGPQEALQLLEVLDRHTVVDLRIEDLAAAHGDPGSHGDASGHSHVSAQTGGDEDAGSGRCHVIALADGLGLMFALASSGALAVRADAADAVAAVRAGVAAAEGPCFVLPDSPQTHAALREALAVRGRSGRRGRTGGAEREPRLIRTRDAASVLAAAAVFDPHADPEDLLEDMVASASGTRSGCVVLAERAQAAGPLMYSQGDPLTCIDGRMRGVGSVPETSVLELVHRLLGAGGELVTLIAGGQVPPAVGEALRARIEEEHPHAEAVLVAGGQESSWMVVGVE